MTEIHPAPSPVSESTGFSSSTSCNIPRVLRQHFLGTCSGMSAVVLINLSITTALVDCNTRCRGHSRGYSLYSFKSGPRRMKAESKLTNELVASSSPTPGKTPLPETAPLPILR